MWAFTAVQSITQYTGCTFCFILRNKRPHSIDSMQLFVRLFLSLDSVLSVIDFPWNLLFSHRMAVLIYSMIQVPHFVMFQLFALLQVASNLIWKKKYTTKENLKNGGYQNNLFFHCIFGRLSWLSTKYRQLLSGLILKVFVFGVHTFQQNIITRCDDENTKQTQMSNQNDRKWSWKSAKNGNWRSKISLSAINWTVMRLFRSNIKY